MARKKILVALQGRLFEASVSFFSVSFYAKATFWRAMASSTFRATVCSQWGVACFYSTAFEGYRDWILRMEGTTLKICGNSFVQEGHAGGNCRALCVDFMAITVVDVGLWKYSFNLSDADLEFLAV